jgi:hypothetical protein
VLHEKVNVVHEGHPSPRAWPHLEQLPHWANNTGELHNTGGCYMWYVRNMCYKARWILVHVGHPAPRAWKKRFVTGVGKLSP